MKRKTGRKTNRPTKEKFESLYYNEEITVDEIAKLLGVEKQTIYNWASYYRKKEVSDKQIFHKVDSNTQKERSKIS